MAKIKEIRKLGPNIKEVKNEKKESLEITVAEAAAEGAAQAIRRHLNSPQSTTLAQTETAQPTAIRERRIAKEDQTEINFRPSYTGGGSPYQANAYTPVGSAESAAQGQSMGERTLAEQRDRQLIRQQTTPATERAAGRPETEGERGYVGGGEEGKDRRRRQNM